MQVSEPPLIKKKTQARSSLRFKFPIDCFRATRPSQ